MRASLAASQKTDHVTYGRFRGVNKHVSSSADSANYTCHYAQHRLADNPTVSWPRYLTARRTLSITFITDGSIAADASRTMVNYLFMPYARCCHKALPGQHTSERIALSGEPTGSSVQEHRKPAD